MQNYKKMLVGTVRTPGSTYSVQEWFNMQGFFSIKITPLGANKVLMEELDEGAFAVLISEYKDWLYEKFDDIRGWDPNVIDNKRVVWMRCHGVPIHAWNDEFFASLARNFGEYLSVDEATRVKSSMDVARIRLRSNGYDVFNAVVTTNINGSLFHIKMVEEWCSPLQWIDNRCCKRNVYSGESSDSDGSHGDEPPLFTAEDDWHNNFDEEGEDGREETDNEEEKLVELDEESFVQKTLGVLEENRSNDCQNNGEKLLIVNEDVGKGNIFSGGLMVEGEAERVMVEREEGEKFHANTSGGSDGAQPEINDKMKVNHVWSSEGVGGAEVVLD